MAIVVPNPRFPSEAAHLPTLGVALERKAETLADAAKDRAPVLTGALRDSIEASLDHDAEGFFGVVIAQVPYAGFVEFGTSRQRPQPFLREALESVAE
jgi:HK97 gp10 family phage protein